MKKLIIGRGRDCDVRVSDSSDMVSRQQAVLTFTFWGKMMLYDTSSNGTFHNGVRLEKANGYRVRRGDQINFAQVYDLDWSKIKNPYRTAYMITGVALLAAILAAVILIVLEVKTNKVENNDPTPPADTDQVQSINDSLSADSVNMNVPEDAIGNEAADEVKESSQTKVAPVKKSHRKKIRKNPSKTVKNPDDNKSVESPYDRRMKQKELENSSSARRSNQMKKEMNEKY